MVSFNVFCAGIFFSIFTDIAGLQWKNKGDVRWARRCDFPGNDIENVTTNGESCGPKCLENSYCTHFSWKHSNGGICWLKSGVANESSAKSVSTESAICGFVKPAAQGKSFRYWDCCKGSCAWNGKASVTAPVNTCEKDGNTTIDINAASGCDQGPSFACNNNQPFSVDDQLSYGFATAEIPNQQERDWCCSCYQLSFTNTEVKGKRMIVQVINSALDLGDGVHFNLQIPGGGVGSSDRGCKAQWGAPKDGWGSPYGGVRRKSECQQLPEQLQAGCRWRFEWFKGAENPTFDFRKVSCPKTLTDISGCKRLNE